MVLNCIYSFFLKLDFVISLLNPYVYPYSHNTLTRHHPVDEAFNLRTGLRVAGLSAQPRNFTHG